MSSQASASRSVCSHGETLSPTDDPLVRHCADCQQSVHFEDLLAAVEYRALAGSACHPGVLADGKFQSLTRDMVGRPICVPSGGGAALGGV